MYKPGTSEPWGASRRGVRAGISPVTVDDYNNAFMLALVPVPTTPGSTTPQPLTAVQVIQGWVDASGQPRWGGMQWLGSSTANTGIGSAQAHVATSRANGHVAVVWVSEDVCGADTYAKPPRRCDYLFISQRQGGVWSAPQVVTDWPADSSDNITLRVDNAGNVAVGYSHWVPNPRSVLHPIALRGAVSWRMAGTNTWRRHVFYANDPDVSHSTARFDMDANGNMAWAGVVVKNGTPQVVAAQGTLAGGFATPQAVSTAGSTSLELGHVRINKGVAAVDWAQASNARGPYDYDRHVAASAAQGQPWLGSRVREMIHGIRPADVSGLYSRQLFQLGVNNTGEVLAYDFLIDQEHRHPNRGLSAECALFVRGSGGAFTRKNLPQDMCQNHYTGGPRYVTNGKGDVMRLSVFGYWDIYDAENHRLISGGNRTLIGHRPGWGNTPTDGYFAALGNNLGAAAVYRTTYTELPSDSKPNGTVGGEYNLWGFVR